MGTGISLPTTREEGVDTAAVGAANKAAEEELQEQQRLRREKENQQKIECNNQSVNEATAVQIKSNNCTIY